MVQRARYVGSAVLALVLLIAGCPGPESLGWKLCGEDKECNDGNPCTKDTCQSQVCHNDADDNLVPLEDDNPCTRGKCEGGVAKHVHDDRLVPPDDGKPCTREKCVNGVATHDPRPQGTPCAPESPLACDANGECPCTDDAQCGMGDECELFKCDQDACVHEFVANGTPVGTQTPFDCNVRQCTGDQAEPKIVPDDTDVDHDTTHCVQHACSGGVSTDNALPVGSTCTMPNSAQGVCNQSQVCVKCTMDANMNALGCPDAATYICDKETNCAPCKNGVQDDPETDVDCGGGTCSGCAKNQKCVLGTDCASQVCLQILGENRCCTAACDGMCQDCSLLNNPGTCQFLPAGTVGGCQLGMACDSIGACVTGLSNGTNCAADTQCVSGFCAAGKCRRPVGGYCTQSSECASNKCDSVSHLCVSCVTNGDCPGTSNCDTTNGGRCTP